jgi:hypothetical protein
MTGQRIPLIYGYSSALGPKFQTLFDPGTVSNTMARVSSPAQKDASRKNGRKSQGERSEESRNRSDQHSCTSGLGAQTVALMQQAVEYGQRSDQWHSYYSPQSPATQYLTNELARSSLLADRAENFRQAELEGQTVGEQRKWLKKQKRRLRYLAGKLSWRPDQASEQLREFGEGVAFLIRSFQNLITDVQSHGCLSPEQVDRVFELCGSLPGPASIRENPLVTELEPILNEGATYVNPTAAFSGCAKPAQNEAQDAARACANAAVNPSNEPLG